MWCCIIPSLVGSAIGSCFGVVLPFSKRAKLTSFFLTTVAVQGTIWILNNKFNLTLRKPNASYLSNCVRIIVKTLIIGVIYSIGINLLIIKNIFSNEVAEVKKCCHKK